MRLTGLPTVAGDCPGEVVPQLPAVGNRDRVRGPWQALSPCEPTGRWRLPDARVRLEPYAAELLREAAIRIRPRGGPTEVSDSSMVGRRSELDFPMMRQHRLPVRRPLREGQGS
jgi:hypothetical protein